ncbi:MAG: hypothetical protein LBC86_02830 [Oscillospiraceae bacterium]|jgi:hypothetical protein|nr:hypothetical protein [Oscillospiraceae bacterium]
MISLTYSDNMFVPISESLSQLASFAILGFFFGIFYEIIRIIRLFKKQSDLVVSITDFVFLSFTGLVTFAYSMELGNGQFRWFFIAGVIFGGVVYFLTVGRLVFLASNFIVRCIKRVFAFIVRCVKVTFLFFKKYIFVPILKMLCKIIQFSKTKIGNIYVFLRKKVLNSSNHLKSKVKVVYNKRTINKSVAGDERNVVKGTIRAIGKSARTTSAAFRKT